MSEASPVTHANNIWGKHKPGIGIPLPDTDAKIVDLMTGEELEPGQIDCQRSTSHERLLEPTS